jgi:hypothetical protein
MDAPGYRDKSHRRMLSIIANRLSDKVTVIDGRTNGAVRQ